MRETSLNRFDAAMHVTTVQGILRIIDLINGNVVTHDRE